MGRDRNPPFVSLLSDWGARDPSAAICRGVVLGIAPNAQIVDITHDVEKYKIGHGALMLWCALPFLPVGAHMAVVDPGVGTARRPLALQTARGDYLVGPDNGILLPGAERLGGVTRAHSIENTKYQLPVVTSTFHGRDLFAPTATHLALGVPLDEMGPPVEIDSLVQLDWPRATVSDGSLDATVIYRDTFGNLKLNALPAHLLAALPDLEHGQHIAIEAGGEAHVMPWAPTFGDVEVGGYLLYEDSYGRLCVAQNQGNAAETLPLAEGTRVTVRRQATE
jgi:S-adenosylmethionine hydrolase